MRSPPIVASVEDAAHVGTPFNSARTCPGKPDVVVATAPDPFPYRTAPAARFAQPVPPFSTGNIPDTSLAKFISALAIAPAVALKNPLKEPIESEPKKPAVDDAYVAERLVVEAFAKVCFSTKVFAV